MRPPVGDVDIEAQQREDKSAVGVATLVADADSLRGTER